MTIVFKVSIFKLNETPIPIPAPVKQDNNVDVSFNTLLISGTNEVNNDPILPIIVPTISVANKPKAIPFNVVIKKSNILFSFCLISLRKAGFLKRKIIGKAEI